MIPRAQQQSQGAANTCEPIINLDDYQETGQTVKFVSEVGLKQAKSTEAYQFLSYLNKNSNLHLLLDQAVIVPRTNQQNIFTVVLHDRVSSIDAQLKQVAQTVVLPQKQLFENIMHINVEVKDPNLYQYVLKNTDFYQKSQALQSKVCNYSHTDINQQCVQPQKQPSIDNQGGVKVQALIQNLKAKEHRLKVRRKRRYDMMLKKARKINQERIQRINQQRQQADQS